MSEEIEVLVKIGNRFYEGKLHPQQVSQHASLPSASRAPVFPELYGELLTITDQGDSWYIKPKQFLQTADFAEIARIVKQFGGEYISAGKSSHFRVRKT
jgi:hypothetical protein